MRLLLDTHVLHWFFYEPRRVRDKVAATLRDPDNDLYASAVSTWEIAIKAALGKIKAEPKDLAREIAATGMRELPITIAHTMAVRDLPSHHKDPFDRILIAQALNDGLTIVSADRIFAAYSVPVLSA